MPFNQDILNGWKRLLQDIEFSKNYNRVDPGHITAKNPVLDKLLPSLLYIKMLTILDDALKHFIGYHSLSLPKKKYRNDLNGRLNFLHDLKKLKHFGQLDSVRKKRNDYGHETEVWSNWTEFENDLATIEAELQHLGYIGQRPSYEFFSERSGAQDSERPEVLAEFNYRYGLKLDGKEILTATYTKAIYKGS